MLKLIEQSYILRQKFVRGYRWKAPDYQKTNGFANLAFVSGGVLASYLVAMTFSVEKERSSRKVGPFSNIFDGHTNTKSFLWDTWGTLRERDQTLFCIILTNIIIFGLWRVPRFSPFLEKYFLHSRNSKPMTLLLSNYCHYSGFHLAANMIALYSFGGFLHDRMGREQFLAFYTSAGLLSSGFSQFAKYLRSDFSKSLGASGAIFGVAGACAHYPDLKVSLIFLPFFSIPINLALPGFMMYDVIGLFKGWRVFDHTAHLSGAVSGYLLYPLSMKVIWPKRKQILYSIGYPLTHRK